jgi:hypothetical protein
VVSARRTRTFTSTRDPSLLMIDISRSTVNRPRSALRIRAWNSYRPDRQPGCNICGGQYRVTPPLQLGSVIASVNNDLDGSSAVAA